MAKEKATYEKSGAELDLETRLENGNQSHRILTTAEAYVAPEGDEGRDFRVEGNKVDNYVGTDPMYQNYGNETDKPGFNSDKSAVDKVTEQFIDNLNPVVEAPAEEPEDEDEDEDEDTETQGGSGGPATPPANPNPVVPS